MRNTESEPVHTGVVLLSISVGWSGFTGLWMLFAPASFIAFGTAGALTPSAGSDLAAVSALGFVSALCVPVFAWLLVKIHQRRNWARITVTILLAIGSLGSLSEQFSAMPWYVRLIGLANLLLVIVGLAMIWQRQTPRRPMPPSRLDARTETT